MMKNVRIGNKSVGEKNPCYIIAEIGLNHNGDIDLAKKLIDEAINAGVDSVKFQKRSIPDLLIKEMLDKPYSGPNSFGTTYGEHRNFLEFSNDQWHEIDQYCKDKKIDLIVSPWDIPSANFLDTISVAAIKIASADVTNIPLLACIAKKDRPVILSTGMSNLEEIDEAVSVLSQSTDNIIILHCISAYPFDNKMANLNVIKTLKDRYPYPIGYSGHEKSGMVVSLGAVALGACVIERHFTLDHTFKGPDHAASLEPDGMRNLVTAIRKLEESLGSPEKKILDIELPIREKLGKSIVSAKYIKKGQVIRESDLTVKGPGSGLKPKFIPEIIGKKAKTDIPGDTILQRDLFD
jgi:sialic acid synthase SpsE